MTEYHLNSYIKQSCTSNLSLSGVAPATVPHRAPVHSCRSGPHSQDVVKCGCACVLQLLVAIKHGVIRHRLSITCPGDCSWRKTLGGAGKCEGDEDIS